MIFQAPNKRLDLNHFSLNLNDIPLQIKPDTKFLGITLEASFSNSKHIALVENTDFIIAFTIFSKTQLVLVGVQKMKNMKRKMSQIDLSSQSISQVLA